MTRASLREYEFTSPGRPCSVKSQMPAASRGSSPAGPLGEDGERQRRVEDYSLTLSSFQPAPRSVCRATVS